METKKSARKHKGAHSGQNGVYKGKNVAYKDSKGAVVFKSTIGDYVPDFVTVVDTPEGQKIIQYRGSNIPPRLRTEDNPNPVLQGSRVVAGFLPLELLPDALRKVRTNYVSPFKENALIDFLPRIVSLVNGVYRGSFNAWKSLKKCQDFVLANTDLFTMAVAVVKVNEKRKYPSCWNTQGFNPEVLKILKGEYVFDAFPMIISLVDKVYAGKQKRYKVEKLSNGEEIKYEMDSYPGATTVVFLCKTIPNLVLAYRTLFQKAVSTQSRKKFPELNKDQTQQVNANNVSRLVLSILGGGLD